MLPDILTCYGMSDLSPARHYSHSRLYCLEPVGIGTPDVECLTGYIARLAQAHGVTPRQLVLYEMAPLLGRARLTMPVNGSLSCLWRGCAQPLNSIGCLARDTVQVLQSLTLRQDLSFLTMLTWANVFPARGLIRRNRVWCPVCYESWRQLGQVIYEPLIWYLNVMTICTKHRCYLQSTCNSPECQREQAFLAPRFVPGHCAYCGKWLGIHSDDQTLKDKDIPEEEWHWQIWLNEMVGALFASVVSLEKEPDVSNLFDAIACWIEMESKGNCKDFARQWQISPASVLSWKNRKQRPEFKTLLRLCYFYGVSPLDVLIQGYATVRKANLGEKPRMIQPLHPQRPHRAFDHERVLVTLQDALICTTDPPPNMRQISKDLDICHSLIYSHYPELCRAISARFVAYQKERGKQRMQRLSDEVRQAVFTIHSQGKYPSAYRVQAILSVPGFIRHPYAIAVWHETLRELGWES